MMYREEQAYINENKGEFERMLEADRQAMAKEMSGSMMTTFDTMFNGGPGNAKKPEEK